MALPDNGFRSPWKAPIPAKRKKARLAFFTASSTAVWAARSGPPESQTFCCILGDQLLTNAPGYKPYTAAPNLSCCIRCSRGFMTVRNKAGERTEPCHTPLSMTEEDEVLPSTLIDLALRLMVPCHD